MTEKQLYKNCENYTVTGLYEQKALLYKQMNNARSISPRMKSQKFTKIYELEHLSLQQELHFIYKDISKVSDGSDYKGNCKSDCTRW